MPFDALVMAAVVREIEDVLPARVDRLFCTGLPGQAPSGVVLVLFRPGMRAQLVISTHPRFSRVHLSFRERAPAAPSPFGLLLRKHLEGTHLVAARQHDHDRVLFLEFRSPLGSRPRLVVEVMGPGSNLALLDGDGHILAAWREEGAGPSRRRLLLPGVEYEPPPPPPGGGWGPFATREIVARQRATEPAAQGGAVRDGAARDGGAGRDVAAEIWEEARCRPRPMVITDEQGQPRDYWCLPPLAHGPLGQQYDSMSELLDDFYDRLWEAEHLRGWHERLGRAVRRQRERQARLVESLQQDMARSSEALRYRTWGELLMTQAAQLPAGHDRVQVTDYYREEPCPVEIPLDPALSGKENAREYFRRYTKARRALGPLKERLEGATTRLAYLEQLEEALAAGPDRDTLQVVEQELLAAGLLHPSPGRRPASEADRPGHRRTARGGACGPDATRGPGAASGEQGASPGRLVRFSLPGGEEVLVGRGAEANDFLTFVLARPDDVWLHVRGIPGSHVILRPPPGRTADPEAIARAAAVAAYFSRARQAPRVEVDWTLRKHVRRRPGGKPGQVLYREERTVAVKPAPPPGAAGGPPAHPGE